MSIFRRLKDWFALQKGIRKTYKPFFAAAHRDLGVFEIVEREVPQDVMTAYESIRRRKGKRYAKLRKTYESLADEVAAHNETVSRLQSIFLSFAGKELLENPEEWGERKARQYLSAATEAHGFVFPLGNPCLENVRSIEDLCGNFSEVARQYEIFVSMKALAAQIHKAEKHIRHDAAVVIRRKCERLSAALGSPEKTYYEYGFLSDFDHWISRRNEEIAERESSLPLFDDIGGLALDPQQRRAAVSGEKNVLIVAGAGSGKTTTICGRVKYLVERKGVNPSEILLLSYSKKSADDLSRKVRAIYPDLDVGTFHKIGLDILKDASGGKFVVEEQFDAIIESYFREELGKDPHALREVLTYYGLFLNNGENGKKYDNEGELFEDLRKDDFVTLRECLLRMSGDPSAMETIKKEKVKSFEEMALANFYFINGISYEYEKPYAYDESTAERRQYTPDFYLKDYDIYHEHYGVDENGRAKQYKGEAEAEYLRGMEWKRWCHQRHQTVCLETYSYEFANYTVFDHLEERLKELGVQFRPLGTDEVRKTMDSVYGGRSFASFINLIKSFLSLYKARYEDGSMFEKLKQSDFGTAYQAIRAVRFLDICKRVYEYYMNRLRGEGKIDFDDMILQSMRALPNLPGHRYRHVIVDEFQDISYSRILFLKALIEHGDSDLFAVGDDWQSIYRFSGCDVNIFLRFQDHFGFAETHDIGTVHRNSQQLQDVASTFVQANPEQLRKEIRSDKNITDPIRIIYYDEDEYSALSHAFALIAKSHPDGNVLLLGRNNRDIEAYLSHRFFFDRKSSKYVCLDYPGLKVRFSTVHASKGLEEDFVVLLSAEDAPNGFPNKTEDDPILNLVMSEPSTFPFAEERRLWYVALTRTRSYVLILVPKAAPSLFVEEMEGSYKVSNPRELDDLNDRISCPRCKGGHLVRRESKDGHPFYGCSNYPYCKYTIDDFQAVAKNKRCLACGDFMVRKQGKWGPFYGCHNYPRCDYREKIDPFGK